MTRRRRTDSVWDAKLAPLPAHVAGFVDPWNDTDLIAYLEKVDRWHGWLQFVDMPQRAARDADEARIEQLFVVPAVADAAIDPGRKPIDWPQLDDVLDTLVQAQRLVVLGDPGSGKTTLVSWLATGLARRAAGPVKDRLGPLIPVPLVLRELGVRHDTTWNDLIDRFLQTGPGSAFPGRVRLEQLAETGQVMFMLDGLDEIGDVATRRRLRRNVTRAMLALPCCRWLLTSRIVGYEEAAWDVQDFDVRGEPDWRAGLGTDDALWGAIWLQSVEVATLAFVAPFDDARIAAFARAWYAWREPDPERQRTRAADLVRCVQRHEGTARLARIPVTLTFAAIVHWSRGLLPDGRAELYLEIAKAYLQRIDERRGLPVGRHSEAAKLAWLAEVAMHMQVRRSVANEKDRESALLVDEPTLRAWLCSAMERRMTPAEAKVEAAGLVEFLARRSGLLLPRGQGRYAFVHLSFQEFFAAYWLRTRTTDGLRPLAVEGEVTTGEDLEQINWPTIRSWTTDTRWRETLALLFELLSMEGFAGADGVVEVLFPGPPCGETEALPLLAAALGDATVSLTQQTRCKVARNAGLVLAARALRPWLEREVAAAAARMLAQPDAGRSAGVAQAFVQGLAQGGCKELELSGETAVDLRLLNCLSTLEALTVCCPVAGLEGLIDLPALRGLWLTEEAMTSWQARGLARLADTLARMDQLQNLGISLPGGTNLAPLSALKNITDLELLAHALVDLRPLVDMPRLTGLTLWDGVNAIDLSPLERMPQLRRLFIPRPTKDTEIAALRDARPDLEVKTL